MLVRASSEGRHSVERSARADRLADRRRRNRQRIFIVLITLAILAGTALVYGLWQRPVRISHIVIYGADQSLAAIATTAMQGKYLGIIPRDSTFFFPEARIRADIVAANTDFAAVSIFRNGLTGLSIKVDYRVPIARWCGNPPETKPDRAAPGADCYFFDANGFVYATSTGGQPVNPFVVYESPAKGNTAPIGMVLPHADAFPAAFDFARQLGIFGSSVSAIIFRDDEVDEYLASGTRITYVLGNEQNAYTALASARADMNLADGSVEYVDLRFSGKVYLKKKGKAGQ